MATQTEGASYAELMERVPEMPEFHEATRALPVMRPHEFARLVESIRTHHSYFVELYPVELFRGKVIDGRMRFLACREVSIMPRYKVWHGEEADLLKHIQEVNTVGPHHKRRAREGELVQLDERETAREHVLASLRQALTDTRQSLQQTGVNGSLDVHELEMRAWQQQQDLQQAEQRVANERGRDTQRRMLLEQELSTLNAE